VVKRPNFFVAISSTITRTHQPPPNALHRQQLPTREKHVAMIVRLKTRNAACSNRTGMPAETAQSIFRIQTDCMGCAYRLHSTSLSGPQTQPAQDWQQKASLRIIEACIFNKRAADNGSPDLQGFGLTRRSFKMQTSINARQPSICAMSLKTVRARLVRERLDVV